MKPLLTHGLTTAAALFCVLSSVAAEPSLVLQSPTNGERYEVGDTMVIRWTADFSRILNGVMLQITPNGRLYLTLDGQEQGTHKAGDPVYSGNQGTFRWVVKATVPNAFNMPIPVISDSCMVKVYAPYDTDSLGGWPSAESNGLFGIANPANMRSVLRVRTSGRAMEGVSRVVIPGWIRGICDFPAGRLFEVDGSAIGCGASGWVNGRSFQPGRQPLVIDSRCLE